MEVKRVEIRIVDNGYIIIWDEVDTNLVNPNVSHEEIVNTKADLKDKLMELFADE